MPCNNPITAYYADKLNSETGKRSLVFNQKLAYQGSDPSFVLPLAVPCGRCHGCRADQALMWSIRAYHESTEHSQNAFITLTYDDAHLPSDGLISKREMQLFFKRLRKDVKFRYIACGEYGGRTRRPHYHAIIFGKDWLEGAIAIKDNLYTNQSLINVWGKGLVSIAPVTMASVCYVCGYVNKKIDDPDTFSLMSRRPGIGHTWLDKFSDDILRTGVVSIEGRQYQVPKRYMTWNDEEFETLRRERAAYARKKGRVSQSLQNFRDQIAREENLRSKAQTKVEKL